MGCKYLRICHLNNCATGVATQNQVLRKYHFIGKDEMVMNYFKFIAEETRGILASLGYKKLSDIIGQTSNLEVKKFENGKLKNLIVDHSFHNLIPPFSIILSGSWFSGRKTKLIASPSLITEILGIKHVDANTIDLKNKVTLSTKNIPEKHKNIIENKSIGKTITYERIIVDIHSGRLFGAVGVTLVDLVTIGIIILSLTGTITWFRHRKVF